MIARTTPMFSTLSDAAQWHKQRRKEMLNKYGDDIRRLETQASSQKMAVPLLLFSNLSLLCLSIVSGRMLSIPQTFLLALFPGSIFSLWQLQILHDCLHGSMFNKSTSRVFGKLSKHKLQEATLFWGSLPCVFGYYLYLKYGHLSHHSHVGDAQKASLQQLFSSDQADFEDGDVLFVAHRMKLLGGIGPTFKFGEGRSITMSISKSGFDLWRTGRVLRNGCAFWLSFLYERFMLVINDAVVSVTGRNYFFPNKPGVFHETCTRYSRVATLLRLVLWKLAGWKSLLFLYLSETLWSLPPHPACAMFVTNHGSSISATDGSCWPSSSTYLGPWYSVLTLGTNYHCEHHDFPSIPFNKLGLLHEIAPEFYPTSAAADQNLWSIMYKAFSQPEFYACMKVGVAATGTA
ncbi:sphingolipid delta-4 desaturase [Fragilaria crotonensis]|nr:sphingolipid delta-4 desaturase [Fragilaria crotonensis]